MNGSIGTASMLEEPLRLELPRLEARPRTWSTWGLRGVSLALLIAVLAQLDVGNGDRVRAALFATPLFLPVLLAMYLALPMADWLIFRRIWGLPLAGFPVLMRKRISNELLLAYSGEAYFYLWARRRTGLTSAPFGTIKDVNILSALAGNGLALALLGIAYPFVTQLEMGRFAQAAVASAALMSAASLLILLLGRRLFTLPRATLWWVFAVHLGRIAITTALCGLLWHLALPSAPIGLWLALAALRLLVTRLPLVPSKELLFAAIAVFLIGRDNDVVALIATTATAVTLLHLFFGAILALIGLIEPEERA